MGPDATVFVPLYILFLTSLNGINLGDALHLAFQQFTSWEPGWIVWLQVIALNAILYTYALPVFKTRMCCLQGKPVSDFKADQAMHHLNGIMPFTILTSMAVFIAGQLGQMVFLPRGFDNRNGMYLLSMAMDVGQAAGNGFLVGVILALQFENRLYKARESVLSLGPRVKLAYRSLYGTIFVVMTAIALFLVFQTFASSGSFYSLGRHGNPTEVKLTVDQFMSTPELIFESGVFTNLKDTLDVFGLRLLLCLLVVAQLMYQLKLLFKNPLGTVQERLTVLNSPQPGNTKQIDIVKNDEFAAVYREINTLILRQQDRLDLTRKRLEDIIDCAADPIISYDSDGKIRLANMAAQQAFGIAEAEFLGRDISGVYPGGAEALKQAHRLGATRLTWQGAGGTTLLLESTLSAGDDEKAFWSTVILRDVTLQAELETTLTRARTEAEHSNHMKSEFLANMSHELRTPLNAILGFTQLLENDKNLTDSQVDRIQVISRSGEHLLGLINDILDISKIEAGKMELHPSVFDLPQFVDDLKELFALKCRSKGLTLYVETLEGVPRSVEGDLGKLRQVMINLVGNAVKFTAEGGVSILTGLENGKVRFAVKDTGRGIPKDEQAKILQPFVQASTTDHEGGTGLGLAISSRYVEMMGGKLDVLSAPGEGSTFSFSLPLPESVFEPSVGSSDQGAIAIKPGHEVTVLVVDDQLTNRLVLKEMLAQAGFSVIEAINGQQAVERARKFQPPIIFMDIKMPVLDGYGAVELLKADPDTKDLRVFALTASAFHHDELKIRQAGFDGFLAKPFKQAALYRLIRDHGQVQLEYETAPEVVADDSAPPTADEFAAAKLALGTEGRRRLDDAALINDFGTVVNLAQEFLPHSPRVFGALKRAAANYDEGAITALLGDLT